MIEQQDLKSYPNCICCNCELDEVEADLETYKDCGNIHQQLDSRRRRTSVSYWDYPSVKQYPVVHPRISLSCEHRYCRRCFHRYICASESDSILTCVHCGNRTELANEITGRPLLRFRLKQASSICVDKIRNTYLIIDSILNRCFEFPIDINSSNKKIKSHALLNGSRPTRGVVAMANTHVVATKDRKHSFLAFYSLKGNYKRAIYLPSGTVVKGLEKLDVQKNQCFTDALWVVADNNECQLLKISKTNEIVSLPLSSIEPRPDIVSISVRGCVVYVCDSRSGNVIEVDSTTGDLLRTVGSRFQSATDVFACPYGGLLVSDSTTTSVCRVPTDVGIRISVICDDDISQNSDDTEELFNNIENYPIRYFNKSCCLLRPVGVASAHHGSMAVLLLAVGNVEISEIRFYSC